MNKFRDSKFWKVNIYYLPFAITIVVAGTSFLLTALFTYCVIEKAYPIFKAWASAGAYFGDIDLEVFGWLMCASFLVFLISFALCLVVGLNFEGKDADYEENEELYKQLKK